MLLSTEDRWLPENCTRTHTLLLQLSTYNRLQRAGMPDSITISSDQLSLSFSVQNSSLSYEKMFDKFWAVFDWYCDRPYTVDSTDKVREYLVSLRTLDTISRLKDVLQLYPEIIDATTWSTKAAKELGEELFPTEKVHSFPEYLAWFATATLVKANIDGLLLDKTHHELPKLMKLVNRSSELGITVTEMLEVLRHKERHLATVHRKI